MGLEDMAYNSGLKFLNICSTLPVHKITRSFYSGLGSILMLHRVASEKGLENIVLYFKERGYDFISLDELHLRFSNQNTHKRPFVLFTFDDGYKDNYSSGYPILKKHDVPFCIYVTTRTKERKRIFWWTCLEDLVKKSDSLKLNIQGQVLKIRCATIKQKRSVFIDALELIGNSLDFNNVESSLVSIFKYCDLDINKYMYDIALSWDEIRELSKDPLVTVGCHTVNHTPLSSLPMNRMKHEIMESRKNIEEQIDKAVRHFSYPFGSHREATPREIALVGEQGFKTATTSRCGNIFPEHKDHLCALPRIPVSNQIWKNAEFLNLYTNGLLPAVMNRFRRWVTD